MSVSLVSNIASVRAQRQLSLTGDKLGRTFERLSSGLRINHASDDPAGLQLADSLRANARIAAVAIRNANDGISVTSIADAALGEIGTILQRLAELATQSANSSYSNSQRSALSSEFIALGSEIDRISKTTTFNNVVLLSNSSNLNFQVGVDGTANSIITVQSVLGTLSALGLSSGGSSTLAYSIISSVSEAGSVSAAQNALNAVNAAITSLTAFRGTIGAAESRLNTAVNFLSVVRENFIAAESRIRDADVAQEVAEMVRLQTLQQAGSAVLAQANQQPQIALSLLQ